MKSRQPLAILSAAAALLIALPAGWYFGSSWWTLWRIREAAQAGDLAALADYVDYPRVAAAEKAEAKRWLVSAMKTPMRDANPGGILAFARRKLAEIERRTASSPLDLRAGLAGMEVGHGFLGPITRRRGDPYVIHHGLDGFEVRDEGMSWEHGPVLTFERRGLRWRLVAMRWGQQ
jgi:Protein of unknown function (DUF2939)